jgi:hypothetical protein
MCFIDCLHDEHKERHASSYHLQLSVVTGVLSHVSIKHLLTKYSCLSKLLFLSLSYPKTQPLVRLQEHPLKTVPIFFLIVYLECIDTFLER